MGERTKPDLKTELSLWCYMHPKEAAGRIRATEKILAKALRWFEQAKDGKEGSDYLNGDGDKYPGDGWADAEQIEAELRASLPSPLEGR